MDPSEIAPTVGVSFSTFKIKLEDGKVKMQVQSRQIFDFNMIFTNERKPNLILILTIVSLFDFEHAITSCAHGV